MKRIAKESSFNIPVYTNERKLIWFNANYNLNSCFNICLIQQNFCILYCQFECLYHYIIDVHYNVLGVNG